MEVCIYGTLKIFNLYLHIFKNRIIQISLQKTVLKKMFSVNNIKILSYILNPTNPILNNLVFHCFSIPIHLST